MTPILAAACQTDDNPDGGSDPIDPGGGGVSLDFVNDIYFGPDGESLTLADCVDTPGRRSASGLLCTAGSPVQLIGPWLTELLAATDWSAVIEFLPSASAGTSGRRIFLIVLGNVDFFTQVALYTQGDGGDIDSQFFEDNGDGDTRFCENTFTATPSVITRIAGARSDTNFALSMGGEAAVTDATNISMSSWTSAPIKVELASGNLSEINGSYIRSIAFSVPGISNVDLATETA
jgi:hypothetical protein